jgi:hypothetical protein
MSWTEWGVIAGALIVLIGVVLEGVEYRHQIKTTGWRPIIPKIGFAVLVAGLATEAVFETFSFKDDSKFRADADMQAALLQQKAADANERAGLANQKAQEAQRDAFRYVKTLLPRSMAIVPGRYLEELHKYSGTPVFIGIAGGDPEVLRFSKSMAWALNSSEIGWKAQQIPELATANRLEDREVSVLSWQPEHESEEKYLWTGQWSQVRDSPEKTAAMAANAFREYLNAIDIKVVPSRFVGGPDFPSWPFPTFVPAKGAVVVIISSRSPVADLLENRSFLNELEKEWGIK